MNESKQVKNKGVLPSQARSLNDDLKGAAVMEKKLEVDDALVCLGKSGQSQKIMKVLDGLPVTIPKHPEDAWNFVAEQLNAMEANRAKAGFALLMLKESLPHGRFLAGLKERGIPDRTAQLCMSVARLLLNSSPPKTAALSNLGYTKLVELARLPEESLEKLIESDEMLDEVDSMSTRDLQKEVRRLKADLKSEKETADRIITEKSKQINELERQVHTKPTPDQLRQKAAEDETQLITEFQLTVLKARSGLGEIQAFLAGVHDERKSMLGLEDSIISQMECLSVHLDRVFEEFGIDLPVDSNLKNPFGLIQQEGEVLTPEGVVVNAEPI